MTIHRLVVTLVLILLCQGTRCEVMKIRSHYDKWTITVNITMPSNREYVSGIVFLIPGTDGVAEPDLFSVFDEEIEKKNQLTPIGRAVVEQGYAYVSFNTRGIHPLETCLLNSNEQPSLIKFRNRCIDKKIRKTISFEKVESDIEEVIRMVRDKPAFRNLKYVVLAVSEGGIHVSRLIRKKRISPDGIIGIGVPPMSPFELFRDQITQNVSYSKLRESLMNEEIEYISEEKLKDIFPIIQDETFQKLKFLVNLTPRGLNLERLNFQSQYMYSEFDKRIHLYTRKKNPIGTAINFYGLEIGNFVSGENNRNFLEDKVPLIDSLKYYRGQRAFFYGEFDSVVAHKKQLVCNGNDNSANCDYFEIPKVGHGLADSNNSYPKIAIELILDSLHSIISKRCL